MRLTPHVRRELRLHLVKALFVQFSGFQHRESRGVAKGNNVVRLLECLLSVQGVLQRVSVIDVCVDGIAIEAYVD